MKWIRTPIGIYDLENSVLYDFDGLCKYHISHCEYYENNPDECRTSDLLEELCDCFVIDETHYMESDLKEMVLYRDCIAGGLKTTIYGAIWTEWGLKYVAKMNDKGGLELI